MRTLKMALVLMMMLLGATVATLPARAQPRSPGRKADATARLTRVKKKRARLLRSKLGLSDDRASKLEAIFDNHARERRQARVAQRRARKALRQLLAEDSRDDKAYETVLDALQRQVEEIERLRLAQITSVRALLTPREQAKLVQMMARAKRHLRRRKNRRRRGR